jgi:hypothetical protein
MKYFDFWSTCAYLIDRHAMKPILDAVLSHVNGWISLKIVAGLNMNPACVPAGLSLVYYVFSVTLLY